MTSELPITEGAPAEPQPPQEVTTPPSPQGEPATSPVEEQISELREQVKEATLAARRAQSQSSSEYQRAQREVAALRGELEGLVTRSMSEDEAKVYRANRIVAAQAETQQTQRSLDQEQQAFQSWSAGVLQNEGFKPDDPRLQQKYRDYAMQDPQNPGQWRAALGLAIADIRKEDATKARDRATKAEDEAKTARRQNERRQESPIDRGAPAGVAAKRPSEMNDVEFAQHLERLNADAARRQRR